MSKRIIIDANFPSETRVVLLNSKDNIEEIEYETINKQQNKGNIYLAKITRIEPSLQAAFIDYSSEKSGFLPFSEIHQDYYHIPVSDQKNSISRLKEISPPNISLEDLNEPKLSLAKNHLIEDEEIDLKKIEILIDEKVQCDFDLEMNDHDIEVLPRENVNDQIQKNYKIQEVIKKGQILLVQLTKEERGNKGASFSTYISLAGKYCVLMPSKSYQNGVSRKIFNVEERKRLRGIIDQLISEQDKITSSVIIRTAGIGHTTLEIKKDYDYLVRLWNKIRETTLKAIAPCFIHEEEGIIQKTIRDMFDVNVKELIVQGSTAYNSAVKFMQDILPSELSRVKEYKNKTPIFSKFSIEEQLAILYQPIVSLNSGGSIVINPTEALISIDVNSGKATSERNIEETALKINLEAAKEIAKQIRLRDLSGLIVIDFIDMYESRNKRIVEKSFKEFLSRDRAKIQATNISSLGLLEMSRQRIKSSFLETNSTICFHCNGKGVIRADESNSMLILRTIENEIFHDNVDIINIFTNIFSMTYLLNNKRNEISFIENKYNIKVNFYQDQKATADSFSIEKIKLAKKIKHVQKHTKPALQSISMSYQNNEQNTSKKIEKEYMKSDQINVADQENTIQETKAINQVRLQSKSIRKKTITQSNKINN